MLVCVLLTSSPGGLCFSKPISRLELPDREGQLHSLLSGLQGAVGLSAHSWFPQPRCCLHQRLLCGPRRRQTEPSAGQAAPVRLERSFPPGEAAPHPAQPCSVSPSVKFWSTDSYGAPGLTSEFVLQRPSGPLPPALCPEPGDWPCGLREAPGLWLPAWPVGGTAGGGRTGGKKGLGVFITARTLSPRIPRPHHLPLSPGRAGRLVICHHTPPRGHGPRALRSRCTGPHLCRESLC